jgi:pyruvate formate lyase activating enzyme
VRENRDGRLVSLVYGNAIAVHVDPVEKKPLYHVCPGSLAFSVATVGCNLRCDFCQNADISQLPSDGKGRIAGREIAPETLVQGALAQGCRIVAYTYTEPTVFFEYALDTAVVAKERGLLNAFVTNGYISSRAIEKVQPYLDACNVDLKSFSDDFYRKLTGAYLAPVLESLQQLKAAGIWIEVTTLLIPDVNDSREELAALTEFLAEKLGPDTPWHISRFFPHHRLTAVPPTPMERLERATAAARSAGLRYVYLGNVPGEGRENTMCAECGTVLIRRLGYRVVSDLVRDGTCPTCGAEVPGIEMGG